jgi:hypothetical protein
MKSIKMRQGILLITILAAAFTAGFAPLSQETTPLISLDLEALTKQIQDAINIQVDQKIAGLESRIAALEALNAAQEARIGELERLANIPTATPAPQGTPTETLEPTRTPNPTGYDCTTELLSPYYYGQFNPNTEFLFQVRITNTGSKTWGNETTIHWSEGLKAEVEPHYAYALPVTEVAPDESFEISIPMRAPTEKKNDGKYEAFYVLNNGDENFCEFGYTIYVP